MRFPRSSRPLALLAAGVLVLAACGTPATGGEPPDQPGDVVSATPVAELSAAQVADQLGRSGFDASAVRFGVSAYRVVHTTTGTSGERGDVASMKENSSDRAVALLLASTGRAVSAPDYLGLGEGPGTHPYGDPNTTVSASLDALRSARTVAGEQGRTLDESVLVSGFSQGGPATMMVGRALAEGADAHFGLGGLAPIAGPYDLSGFERDAADDRIDKASLYLAYFVVAWDRLYGLSDSPGQAFRAPYAAQVETLFDGNHTGQQIAAALPPAARDLFVPEFLDSIRHPTGVLAERLRALDSTCDWKPGVPVHLFHATGDRDVAFANAEYCRSRLATRGAAVDLTDLGAVDHNTTVRRALPQVLQAFAG